MRLFIHIFHMQLPAINQPTLIKLKKLNNLINKAIKLAFNLNILTSSLLKDNCVMNYDMSVEYFSCNNMFFMDKISSFQTEHEYRTRAASRELFDLPFYRRTKCKRLFLYRGLYFWNKLPLETRNIPNNLQRFKKSIRKYILNRS